MTDATEAKETRHVRMYREHAEQLAWIIEFEKKPNEPAKSAAELLSELAGEAIAKRFEPYRKRVEKIKAVKAEK